MLRRWRNRRRQWLNRIIYGGLALAVVCVMGARLSEYTALAAPPLYTNAAAHALIDVSSGTIVASSNGDKKMLIASLTKIMTAIVAIEYGNASDFVTVSSRAAHTEGSSIYLKPGEKMKLEDLLYGLMLRSGNDAAMAIAEHVGGSVEGFVWLMNEKSAWLGLQGSHWQNPSGLDHPEHYSTANDLARLTAYALHHEEFRKIVSARMKKASSRPYAWKNKHKLLFTYDGADGVKTGFTKAARRTLVTSATRGNQQFVAVTLRDSTDWVDHKRMLNYGFKYYRAVGQKARPELLETWAEAVLGVSSW